MVSDVVKAVDDSHGIHEDFTKRLIELSDSWQVYCGRGLDLLDTMSCTPLHIQVPVRVQGWGYNDPDSATMSTSDEALLAWRFVCFGHD